VDGRFPGWDLPRLRYSWVASAVRHLQPVDQVHEPMELTTLIRVWVRRLPFIALVGLLCGLGAWLVDSGRSTVYEQKLSFVLRPADGLPVEEADRVAGTLAERDSAITQTMLGLVQSVPVSGGSGSHEVERTVTLRPGSSIIDVELEGDKAAVAAAGRSFLVSAPERVRRSYSIYALEPLGAAAAPTGKPSAFWRTFALAVLLGCALALGVAVLEYRARGRPSPDVKRSEAEADFAPLFDEDEEEPKPVRTRSAKR
jgi:hypothetical protein